VGDTFGGPPQSAIDAQTAAFRVARPDERALILARLGVIRHVTDAALRRPYGYLYGLDQAVAAQYELPDKYVIGLSDESAAGLGYVLAWVRLLPYLSDAPAPRAPSAALEPADDGARLIVRAAPGAVVALPSAARPFPAPVSHADPRMLALDLAELPGGLAAAPRVTLDSAGVGVIPRDALPADAVLVQPLLLGPEDILLAIGEPTPLP
jgi:hypothetical protein